jgi:hypothetical protein
MSEILEGAVAGDSETGGLSVVCNAVAPVRAFVALWILLRMICWEGVLGFGRLLGVGCHEVEHLLL